eukprot:COSAG01_NODE_2951_length_6804_cov_32.584489_2_plen_90_part_00
MSVSAELSWGAASTATAAGVGRGVSLTGGHTLASREVRARTEEMAARVRSVEARREAEQRELARTGINTLGRLRPGWDLPVSHTFGSIP